MLRHARKQFVTCLLLLGVFGFVRGAQAVSPPNIITYQGRVLNANGVPVSNSSLSMSFALYTASSGGSCVWSNSSSSCATTTVRTVSLTTGLFTEYLGDTSNSYAAIDDTIFADNAALYLEVVIAGETLTPRRQITAAPYALNAETLDGIDSTVLQLFETGSSRTFEDDAPVIIGSNSAFSYGSGGVGDARIADEIEVMGDGYIDNDLVVGASTSSSETITNSGFSLSGDDLFIAGSLGVETAIYTDGSLDVVGTATVGDLSCSDCLDFAELSDALTLDASTTIAQTGTSVLQINNNATSSTFLNLVSTGDFQIQDNGSTFFFFNDDGSLDYSSTQTTTDAFDIVVDSLTTGRALDMSIDALTTGRGLLVSSTSSSLTSGRLVDIDHSATYNTTNTLSGNGLRVARSLTMDGAGNTLTVSGDLVSIQNVDVQTGGTLTDTSDLLSLTQGYSSATGDVIQVLNAGTGRGLFLNQDGNGIALDIDTEGSTADAINIDAATTTGQIIDLNAESLTTGTALSLSNASMTTGTMIDVTLSSNSVTSGSMMRLDHTATYNTSRTNTASGLSVVRNLTADGASTTLTLNQPFVRIANIGSTTNGGTLSDSSILLSVEQNYTSASGSVVSIQNAGPGIALILNQDGNGPAISVDAESTTTNTVYIDGSVTTTGQILSIAGGNFTDDSGRALFIDVTESTETADLVLIQSDYSSANNNVFWIEADGEVFSDVGITAAGITNYRSTSIITTGNFSITTGGTIDLEGNVQVDFPSSSGDEAVCHNAGEDATNDTTLVDCASSPTADYAEQYSVASGIEYGDIVVPGTREVTTSTGHTIVELVKSSRAYQGPIVGIVSNNYSDFTSAGYDIAQEDNPMPVALVGRVPVKVTTEGGSISAGDYLTTSSTPGVAMKATKVGRVIGMALENWDGVSQTLMVHVNNSWFLGDILGTDGTSTLVTDNVIVSAVGTASADEPTFDSYGLSLRGSAWNGSEAQAVEMMLQNAVESENAYRLSVRNTSETEVAYITNEGVMKIAGDMVLGGYLYPSDRGSSQTDAYIYYDGSSGVGGGFMRTNAKGWSTGSYDFAEMFPSDESLVSGDVVVFAGMDDKVKRSTGDKNERLAGIVSTRPGFLAGENSAGAYPIALVGRVPTKVNVEHGAIAVGDALITSSVAGEATKALYPGQIIGYALESYTGSESDDLVTAYVNVGYWSGDVDSFADNRASQMTSSGASGYGALNMSGNIYMATNSLLGIGKLEGIGSVWSIESDGTIKTEALMKTVITSHQGEKVETIAVTSPEAIITLTGTARLVDGRAEVRFEEVDPAFNDVISAVTLIRIFVTPVGPASLYVSQKDQNHFVVERFAGSFDVEFDWMASAYRKGYEPQEVQTGEMQETSSESGTQETDLDTSEEETISIEPGSIDGIMTSETEFISGETSTDPTGSEETPIDTSMPSDPTTSDTTENNGDVSVELSPSL